MTKSRRKKAPMTPSKVQKELADKATDALIRWLNGTDDTLSEETSVAMYSDGKELIANEVFRRACAGDEHAYRDWETDRKSTRLNSSHITRSRMPSSA